jgi:hypothetical protein
VTPLDVAHAAMAAAPADDHARLAFYEALAAAELVLLLDETPGDSLRPAVFDTEDLRLALAFDEPARLAAFTGAEAAYAALPGRTLIAELAGRGLGLGLNLGVAPSSFLMPPEAVDWLAGLLASPPKPVTARPEALGPPDLPEALLAALDRRLARAAGLARYALLASARWPETRPGHLIALIDPAPGAEPALAQAIGEALIFSGLDSERLDLTFLAEADPLTARLARRALRIDLPAPPTPMAPGSDPALPPKLR